EKDPKILAKLQESIFLDLTSNKKPVAKSTKFLTAKVGETVVMDGSASSDGDNDELSYCWAQVLGTPTKLQNSDTSRASIVPHVADTLRYILVVHDGKVNSNPLTVTVAATIPDVAPPKMPDDHLAGIEGFKPRENPQPMPPRELPVSPEEAEEVEGITFDPDDADEILEELAEQDPCEGDGLEVAPTMTIGMRAFSVDPCEITHRKGPVDPAMCEPDVLRRMVLSGNTSGAKGMYVRCHEVSEEDAHRWLESVLVKVRLEHLEKLKVEGGLTAEESQAALELEKGRVKKLGQEKDQRNDSKVNKEVSNVKKGESNDGSVDAGEQTNDDITKQADQTSKQQANQATKDTQGTADDRNAVAGSKAYSDKVKQTLDDAYDDINLPQSQPTGTGSTTPDIPNEGPPETSPASSNPPKATPPAALSNTIRWRCDFQTKGSTFLDEEFLQNMGRRIPTMDEFNTSWAKSPSQCPLSKSSERYFTVDAEEPVRGGLGNATRVVHTFRDAILGDRYAECREWFHYHAVCCVLNHSEARARGMGAASCRN
ncbi:MAG: hypothetical protein HN348_17975, partial [Proteobacteria bacterium]|nr:hypothetical protein [Pseudomonadota bacterium]